MDITIVVPPLGESVVEGTITRWLKQPGEAVARDEALVEIMTDKITMQVPAPAAGRLTKILVAPDQVVPIGAAIGILAAEGATGLGDHFVAPPPPPPAETPPEQHAPIRPVALVVHAEQLAADGIHDSDGSVAQGLAAVRSSPVVRRLAHEHFIDLRKLHGTGRAGRITKEDVLGYIGRRHAVDRTANFAWPHAEDEELVPITGVRKVIADRMAHAVRTIPHVTTFDEADLTAVVAFKRARAERIEAQHGVHLTYLPFLAKAALYALKEFPLLNAHVTAAPDGHGDVLRVKKHVHLGVAVARDNRLIVPVVRHAAELSLLALARAIAAVAGRANADQLLADEVKGSTFTLSNAGVYGALASTPIINAPEVAIVGVHAVQERAVVRDGQIVVRPMMNLALSFDHRVIDGAYAVKFLRRLALLLEDPEAWILNAV
jgi:2-oxoglutarate dehydrogenase E2 component (dihydrolipoamide succinyltransferase)